MDEVNLHLVVKAVFRVSFIVFSHIYYLSYLAWMVILLPLKLCGCQSIYYKIEGRIMYGLVRCVAMWNHSSGYEVLEVGDDITECLDARTLALVNHQSAGDIAILFSAFITRSQILPNIMWIMDNFLKYSTIGVVCLIHHDFFIFQGKEMRQRSLEALKQHLTEYYIPLRRKWLIIFPEGGFLSKRRNKSQEYGKRNNLPHVQHVTIPRIGALKVVMDTLNPKEAISINNSIPAENVSTQHLKYILDITIGYPNGKPLSAWSILFGHQHPFRTTICYRLYSISEVPQNNDDLQKWILDRWVEKERMLEVYYRSGEFPLNHSKSPVLVRENTSDFIKLHFKFLGSLISQYLLIKLIYQLLS